MFSEEHLEELRITQSKKKRQVEYIDGGGSVMAKILIFKYLKGCHV